MRRMKGGCVVIMDCGFYVGPARMRTHVLEKMPHGAPARAAKAVQRARFGTRAVRARDQSFGMRMRLIISEPEIANSSDSGWNVKPAIFTAPNQRSSLMAPIAAATAIMHTSAKDVGIGVPSKYFTLPVPADISSAVTLYRARRDTPHATKNPRITRSY